MNSPLVAGVGAFRQGIPGAGQIILSIQAFGFR